jgi:hypothetical protein
MPFRPVMALNWGSKLERSQYAGQQLDVNDDFVNVHL